MINARTPAALRLAALDANGYRLAPDRLDRLLTPALVVYEAKARGNIARMIDYMGGNPDRWRPHLKTTKIPEVYALLVDAGVRSFKCATVREAQCLLDVLESRQITDGDLLIAYPIQGPAIERACALAARFGRTPVSILSEDADHAARVPGNLGLFVDVNPGMNRTGIPMQQTQRIAGVIRAAGKRFRGVHFYDGHVHQPTAGERRAAVHANYDGLTGLLERLASEGLEVPEVITSGTPSFRYALDYPGFDGGRLPVGDGRHRVSPGTVVFHDYGYDELLEDLELEPAAVVVTRVVSHPRDGIVTCDAGSKSIAAECGDPVGFVIGRADMVGLSPSEEHYPIALTDPSAAVPPLGEALYLVPRHVCPTVNLAEQALMVHADGTTVVVRVAARAHDLLYEA